MRSLLLVASLLVLASAAPALAQPEAAPAETMQQYTSAQELYKQGRYAAALPLFREVLGSLGSPNARLYLARCLRELGRLPEAYAEMATSAREASARAEQEPRFAQTAQAASEELAVLEAQIGRVELVLPERPAGLVLEFGGKSVEADRLGAPLPVAPGAVSVRATAPGRAPFEKVLSVGPGELVRVTVSLAPPAPPASRPVPPRPRAAPPAPAPADEGGGRPGLRVAGYVAAGVGVLGMGAFAVAGLMANSRFAEIERECGGKQCTDPAYATRIDEGETLDAIANAGLGVGLAGLAAGGTMILIGSLGGSADGARQAPAHGGLWLGLRAGF
ncbi:MAG: CDC27 family protein [Deltaproteobacteria bacterium]|nr:CDC27 family protein [Deltaproteobacteria bacterium]